MKDGGVRLCCESAIVSVLLASKKQTLLPPTSDWRSDSSDTEYEAILGSGIPGDEKICCSLVLALLKVAEASDVRTKGEETTSSGSSSCEDESWWFWSRVMSGFGKECEN